MIRTRKRPRSPIRLRPRSVVTAIAAFFWWAMIPPSHSRSVGPAAVTYSEAR